MEVLRISKALEGGAESPKAGIVIEALLDEIEQVTAKNGSPYIRGMLYDRADVLPIKAWDCTKEAFLKNNGLKDEACVVQVLCDIDYYDGKAQGIIKPFSDRKYIHIIQKSPEVYVKKSMYNPEDMLQNILNLIDNQVENPILKEFCKKTLSYEGILYYPYSKHIHTEKAGYLAHIYNCVSKIVNMSGDPKTPVKDDEGNIKLIHEADMQVVLATILSHRILVFFRYAVDKATGKILWTSEVTKALYGEYQSYTIVCDILSSLIKEPDSGLFCNLFPEAHNLLHSVMAVTGMVEPVTAEAVMARDIICSELNQHSVSEIQKTIAPGEVAKISLGNGKSKTVVSLKK